jgi:hypothetical protein
MSSTSQRKPAVEPDPELVERAIVQVLELVQRQGITAADFIQMLDSGMRISDLLNAMDVLTNAGLTIDSNTATRSRFGGSHDS